MAFLGHNLTKWNTKVQQIILYVHIVPISLENYILIILFTSNIERVLCSSTVHLIMQEHLWEQTRVIGINNIIICVKYNILFCLVLFLVSNTY